MCDITRPKRSISEKRSWKFHETTAACCSGRCALLVTYLADYIAAGLIKKCRQCCLKSWINLRRQLWDFLSVYPLWIYSIVVVHIWVWQWNWRKYFLVKSLLSCLNVHGAICTFDGWKDHESRFCSQQLRFLNSKSFLFYQSSQAGDTTAGLHSAQFIIY